MTFTSILTHVEPGEIGASRLACAADLADRLGALLIGVGAEAPAPASLTDPYGMATVEWQAEVLEQAQANLRMAAERFAAAAGDRAQEWRASLEPPLAAVCREARAADLIVASSLSVGGTALPPAVDPGRLVLQAGRPVLVAPPAGRTLQPERILVAWKDTREARRAVADALPFLTAAEAVLVLAVCPPGQDAVAEAAADDVTAWLRRHGARASPKVAFAEDDRACEVLCDEAQAMRAGLIVAGGYGHGRLREWVLGGVTRGLLRRPECFVFMSH